jgi:hypothetical protein
MTTSTQIEGQDRTGEAVALIDAWLSEHSWWADSRAIDFALDVRAVLADRERSEEDTVAAVATAN